MNRGPDHDVLIMGAGLAGLTLARQLRSALPEGSIAVVDRLRRPLPEAAFKVGESTVEGGALYLRRDQGLGDYLGQRQLYKNGLRFYLGDPRGPLSRRPELGSVIYPPVSTYQLDRGVLENDLRARAREEGIQLLEGFVVRRFELDPSARHTVELQVAGAGRRRRVSCRWLVDASGRASLIQKRLGLRRQVDHPVNAAWFRIPGRIDLGQSEPPGPWHGRDPGGDRYFSTNHLAGPGYWVWLIPLVSGATSIGIVAAEEGHPFDEIRTYESALAWLAEHEPVLPPLLADREPMDFRAMRGYAYLSRQLFSPDRWACVGEAGIFLDPLYSLGTDFIALGNSMVTEMVRRDAAGEAIGALCATYDQLYRDLAEVMFEEFLGSYHVFGHSRVFVAKLFWDTVIYWCVFAPFVAWRLWAEPDELARLGVVPRYLALNRRVQQLLRDWARRAPDGPLPEFLPYPNPKGFLATAHLELGIDRTPEAGRERLAALLPQVEEMARALCLRALEETVPEEAAARRRTGMRPDPYALGLDGGGWEAGGPAAGEPGPGAVEAGSGAIEAELRFYFGEMDDERFDGIEKPPVLAPSPEVVAKYLTPADEAAS